MERILYDGEVHVHYGQIYVVGDNDTQPMPDEACAGQTSGLCGAAQPGALFMTTGLHTGSVGFRVEAHDTEPPIDDGWEDIVEVSFRPASPQIDLMEWAGESSWPLALEQTDLRVRYSAIGMDAAREVDTTLSGSSVIDRYLLQFWPAPSAPDRVIKQVSSAAAYWHRVARELPAPDSPEMRARVKRRQQMLEDKPQRAPIDPDSDQSSGPQRQVVSIRYEKGT